MTQTIAPAPLAGRTVIASSDAPPAIGPYSQGIREGRMVFLAGQIPLVGTTGNLVEGGITEQTEQVIHNIKSLLATQALDLRAIVKATVFLADMNEFAAMNAVYTRHFVTESPDPTCPPPARSTVQVARLPKDARVEIEVIAIAPEAPVV
ncbi:deaminase [Verrucomicrobia bacterium LW23]|nr:deaminase [Verrucomicrobia bacterium LW23]